MDVSNNQITFLPKTICLLKLNVHFNSFIAGNNYICDYIPDCIENFAGFNYEYDSIGKPQYSAQNCSLCPKGYTEISDEINTTKVLDNNICFLDNDLNILKNIIDLNNNLKGKQVLEIGQQKWNKSRLISLDLSNLSLSKLPKKLGELSKLISLDISSNKIKIIPKSLTDLTKLTKLNLNQNKITRLPENIGDLLKLKNLEIKYNKIAYLPNSISKLKKLNVLFIDNNNLKELPSNMCDLNINTEQLNSFQSGNNFLCDNIPNCISNSIGLDYSLNNNLPVYKPQNCLICEVGFTGIVSFPNNISLNEDQNCFFNSDLNVLQDIININENLKGKRPLEIGYQVWQGGRITSLALNEMEISALPISIGLLTNLQILHLDNNKLTSLPESISNLENLKELVLDENYIKILPKNFADLTKLEGLSMDNNELEELPINIGNLNKLRELYLNYNQLSALPQSFGNLNNLEILLIYYNKLESLPNNIGNLSNLQILYSSNNLLTSIPESISNLNSLHKLWINSNKLTTLPQSLCELPENCNINISYNCLDSEYHFNCIESAGHHSGYWCK